MSDSRNKANDRRLGCREYQRVGSWAGRGKTANRSFKWQWTGKRINYIKNI